MEPGRRWLGCLALVLNLAAAAFGQTGREPSKIQLWRLEVTGLQADPGVGDVPLPVGSIQKPFVAKAWAAAHPGDPAPRFTCETASRCWLHQGHGELDLAKALAVSCNTYFRRLAEATPRPILAMTLTTEGFLNEWLTPDSAIGLSGLNGLLTIRPSALLEAYVRLIKAPWPVGESIRGQVLAGLREAALTGTAALGQRGYWAKTGTVPIEGDPLHTCGLAVAVDDTGWAILARLPRGSGREAAAALAEPLARLRPWQVARTPTKPQNAQARVVPSTQPLSVFRKTVTIRLLELVRSRRFVVRNAGPGPISTDQGYLGPGGSLELRPGTRIGPGLVEIRTPATGVQRRLEGELFCGQGPGGTLSLLATLSLREYADGVMAAELPFAASGRRIELGGAILRFLEQNHRHPDADVCDSTHCAWFIGRGPRLNWDNPRQARALADAPPRPLSDPEWTAILEAARQPGPSQWTSHCGGTPLSPHRLWGFGDLQAPPCLRHAPGQETVCTRPWVREWRTADLAKAFGAPVERLEIGAVEGVWVLRLWAGPKARSLRYDEAHRTLATVLGWGALPSPADRLEPISGGFRISGVGLGHRVGLCLGE